MNKFSDSKSIPEKYDCLAPDGSEIRLLTSVEGGSFCHCTLPAGKTSQAIVHKTVDEIWHFLSGEGEIWRNCDGAESVTAVKKGMTIQIQCGTKFQFRNTGKDVLQFLITTIPSWPGPTEAVFVTNHWEMY